MEKITLQEILKLDKSILVNKIIVFPTDTVYGVGTLYEDEIGKEKIYQMKKRDYGKPLPVLCANVAQVKSIAYLDSKYARFASLWPGALTIILKKLNEDGTIAVRIPNSKIAIKLLEHFGPLSTTSVNYSGEKEINSVSEIALKFGEYVDYIVTDSQEFSSVPSTIIDCSSDNMSIIRQGSIIIK